MFSLSSSLNHIPINKWFIFNIMSHLRPIYLTKRLIIAKLYYMLFLSVPLPKLTELLLRLFSKATFVYNAYF